MLFSFPTQNVTESDNWLVSYGQRMILNMATIRYIGFLEIFMFCRVTVIEFQICCCLPYFIKIGHAFRLQTQTPIPAKCSMRGCYSNGRYHSNRITADMSGT